MKRTSIRKLACTIGAAVGLITGAVASADENPVADSTSRLTNDWLSAQIAELSSMSLEDLHVRLAEIEKNIPTLAEIAQQAQAELRELRAAGYDSEPAKEVRAQIAELQKHLERVVDELPEVKAKAEQVAEAKAKLFQNMQLRTRVLSLIAVAERNQGAKGDETGVEPVTE